MTRDKFYRRNDQYEFGNPNWTTAQIDESSEGVTYMRATLDSPCVIRRISVVDNITTIEFAFGEWESRSTLTYKD